MELVIRKTKNNEFFTTENLTRETFWNLYQSGCTEHFVIHNFRKSKAWVEQLDIVALINDKIVGHIISTKAAVGEVEAEITGNIQHSAYNREDFQQRTTG